MLASGWKAAVRSRKHVAAASTEQMNTPWQLRAQLSYRLTQCHSPTVGYAHTHSRGKTPHTYCISKDSHTTYDQTDRYMDDTHTYTHTCTCKHVHSKKDSSFFELVMRSCAAELFTRAKERKLLKLNMVLAQKEACDSAGWESKNCGSEQRWAVYCTCFVICAHCLHVFAQHFSEIMQSCQ